MNVADILDKAADLIEPEGCWTQGRYAGSADGSFAAPESSRAVCWCAVGAIQRVAGLGLNDYFDAKGALADHLQSNILPWNDAPERTQAEVVSKLREAAALAREQGK